MINILRRINASTIYVSSDGLNQEKSKPNEIRNIIDTRNYILKNIDWDCNIFLKFNNNNLGCKNAVSNAINWFFKHEEKGIILEEDCLPNNSFFYFCEKMLLRYKSNLRVGCITGVNFQGNRKVSKYSNYFSKYNHCWGWATWRESWNIFDKDMSFWTEMKSQTKWEIDPSMLIEEKKYWEQIFEKAFLNQIDSWAYPWLASLWFSNKLTVTPELNLVSNRGFDGNATHTKNRFSNFSNMETSEFKEIISNPLIEVNKTADEFTFRNHFFENFDINFKKKLLKKAIFFFKMIKNPFKSILYFRDKFQ